MSLAKVVAPRLPLAPAEYDPVWMNSFINILRLYFAQLDNGGPLVVSSQNVGSTVAAGLHGAVVSALRCIEPTPGSLSAFTSSLPTQASLPYLRSGDIYYDTTANNVLKIKP